MDLYVRHAEREERIEVDERGGTYHFVIGDRAYVVDAARLGSSFSLMIDGSQTEASVVVEHAAAGTARYWVSTSGGGGPVEILEPLAYLAARSRGAQGRQGRQGADQVRAIMPGRVVAVLVEPGDAVERGRGVLVIEAMKMENEIAAESDGVVAAIHVSEGALVEIGDPLFEIGPALEESDEKS